jgi:choline transport protein
MATVDMEKNIAEDRTPDHDHELEKKESNLTIEDLNVEGTIEGVTVNASGHRDELQRHFSIWSLCGLALTIDNAWVALGGSLSIAVCKLPLPRYP